MMSRQLRRAFQKAIQDQPNDPGVRLVFADWLAESGLNREAEQQRWLGKIAADPLPRNAAIGGSNA
jgi:uncharacterized protein (TIGR02996 family)